LIASSHAVSEHRRALFRVRAAAAAGLQHLPRLPALEDVDTTGVDRVRADRDVGAANCPASLFDDAHTVREGLSGIAAEPVRYVKYDRLASD